MRPLQPAQLLNNEEKFSEYVLISTHTNTCMSQKVD